MPTKPTCVYVILEADSPPGSQVPNIPAWRLEIKDGQTIEETIKAHASLFPMGQKIITVTDTKTTAYSTAPALTEVA